MRGVSRSSAVPRGIGRFWAWYERHYALNSTLTTLLFCLQLVHLYWLTAHVVAHRLMGWSYFSLAPFWEKAVIVVDYTEIPALVTTSIFYVFALRRGFAWKPLLFLLAINSQWLHLFWITDEFVVNQFAGTHETILPTWLAWVAIAIDYLELPVIFDTIRSTLRLLVNSSKSRSR